MPRPVVQVEGAAALRRALRQAGDNLGDLKQANDAAAQLVANDARPRTPRLTGRLAATVRASGTKTQATIRAGRSSVPYAGVVHYGWPARGIRAQPWLIDAAQQDEPGWTAIYLQAIERIIERVEREAHP